MSAAGNDFSESDLEQLQAHAIAPAEAERYLALLRKPFAAIRLSRPCSVGDGIRLLDAADVLRMEGQGAAAAMDGRVTKFVPAS